MRDNITPVGIVEMVAVDADGRILDWHTGRNLVVGGGRMALARLLAGAGSGKEIATVGLGSNPQAPANGDTAISGFSKPIAEVSYPDAFSVRFAWEIGFTEANGISIQEVGLVCADGSLFARKTREAIVKTSAFKLVCSWTILF